MKNLQDFAIFQELFQNLLDFCQNLDKKENVEIAFVGAWGEAKEFIQTVEKAMETCNF